ncbi:multidrug resistance-associated protein 9 isoform X2 [Orussus abietinus]|uniref:multidrug resistance-associated protein 9 isoform X2 n=1 Tax=Orussus abietinus TaxID=222816 RepID=UPI0006265804|nr:multidrug resistance-associated protein 9 isoform X2 [Orussus abietinus]
MMSSSSEPVRNNHDGLDANIQEEGSLGRLFPRTFDEMKHSSAYVPHNRFSRYTTALTNLAPIRFKRTPGSELPLDKIGLLSSASLNWLNEYLSAGCKNGMIDKPLPTIAQQDSCEINGPRLDGLWHAHVVERGQTGASVPLVAWRFVRTRVLVASFIYFLGMIMSLLNPIIFLQKIILTIEDRNNVYDKAMENRTSLPGNASTSSSTRVSTAFKDASVANSSVTSNNSLKLSQKFIDKLPDSVAHVIMVDDVVTFTYVGILVLVEVISCFLIAWSVSLNLRTACRLRSACLAMVYKKLVRSSLRYNVSAHQIMRYYVPDSETLYELIINGPLLFTGPFLLIITATFIWYSMGHWALIGISVLIIEYSVLIFIAYLAKIFATKAVEHSVKHVGFIEEFLNNIYLAKVSLWDSYFERNIKDTRSKELSDMKLGGLAEGWSLSMVHLIPIITVCVTTLASLLMQKQIAFARYIPVLALLLINVKHCTRSSWLAMSGFSRGITSLNKLKTILTMREAERFPDKPIDKNLAIAINWGNFTWKEDKCTIEKSIRCSSQFYLDNTEGVPISMGNLLPPDTLMDINFFASKGKLIGICGQPNSGKTSLLLSIMGHLHRVSGHVAIDGKCAFAPEVPWLFKGTVKENIIFGENFDSTRYYKAVKLCSLTDDIAALPASDDTELNNLSLTPAVKQKIALARVLYMFKDINILDNPLADVSANDCKEIFEKCIMHALGCKTVIMVSDKIQFLNRCDIIYVMREGKIVEQGNHEELLQWNSEYTQIINLYAKRYQQKYSKEQISSSTQLVFGGAPRAVLRSTSTTTSFNSFPDDGDNSLSSKQRLNFDLLPIEYSSQSPIDYCIYVKHVGSWFVTVFICLIALCYSFSIAISPLFFIYIVKKSISSDTDIILTFLNLMGISFLCGIIFMAFYNIVIFKVATRLHERWLATLFRGNISYLICVSPSILLNMFIVNLQEVDFKIPRSAVTVLMHTGISILSVITLALLSSWLLIPIVIFIFASIFCTFYVRGTTLSLYEGTMQFTFQMCDYLANVVEGRGIIQSSQKGRDVTRNRFHKFCDSNSTHDFMLYATKLWIEYRIKLLSALTLGTVTLMCASLPVIRNRFELTGLSFICTLQLTTSIVHLTGAIVNIFMSCMTLTGFDKYLKSIPKDDSELAKSAKWIGDSGLKFEKVFLANDINSTEGPLNFTIAPGEKVGIVGGSESKRTMVSAMYKLLQLSSGNIFIGHTNIVDIPSEQLKQCVSFVPANPVLFNATIKCNLDPMGDALDKEIMAALQKVYLWEKVSKLAEKLESNSRNVFTKYERRLIFFARAILKKTTKIIIVEEPSDDLGPNNEIMETIMRETLAEYTVIVMCTEKVGYCQRTITLKSDSAKRIDST